MRKCGWVRATCVLFTSMADRSPCSELFCLFTWGANSYGQLGLGHKEDVLQPEGARLGQCLEGGVRTLAGGGGHSAVVTGAGEVLLCGQNNKGQLGLGHTVDALLFTPCAALRGHNVVQVAGGWDFTLILTGDGRVLACGSNAFGQLGVPHHPAGSSVPLPIKSLTEKVVEVAAGLRHALAVTEAGRVYQWGTGMAAQAKRTLQPRPVPAFLVAKQPCQVPVMENVKVRKVAAGACHSVCLTEEGAVFMWGSNKHGQLTSSEPFLCQALRIHPRLFKGAAVSAVWSGWTHVVCRTERGDIFTWGRADYGQLGRKAAANGSGRTEARDLTDGSSTQSATCIPLTVLDLAGASQGSLKDRVHLDSGEWIAGGDGMISTENSFYTSRNGLENKTDKQRSCLQVSCGSEHNLAVVGGRCLSWGWNEHGMCGDGTETNLSTPQPITALQNTRPVLIGCGAGHSMVFCHRT
ncbi:secretion-regulating guanine nucleotide exchange factor isoform X1 [Acipenser ruthenus]|uniref:secretion-regulating guanine nucleotide exchange factor isoform X1 n=1 Tax=Acipenser ruthenus TaxID=7906 RepID=UPI002740F7EE|nr:secretion-regulating guanine nucleotide exchange factor isoform X1 [Acipenser ruthenus]